ncbi:PQQ-dependent sugar dehydrogenase [Spirosoma utsteinense]|uniref:Glucose/arabinose dehydrogenase n=1 Tax=Spirosoma utsteinense TaxID=2585773 RepID=A0ABR6W098_9BACT|nr:PQQ-dependent sugar dehydrogenase [Spirosoma utsteinense]MBC3784693.1 glucose/arabinose dehydrogenase [Spirosoma utsteinense]MBC3789553.1 glucose/arabinose dehydrogenase [Spirosoma utsteinense]
MKKLNMFGKAITTFAISLAATSGVALLLSFACRPADRSSVSVSVLDSAATGAVAPTLKAVNAYPKLKFESPVEYTHANDGTNRVFVVEQVGRIRVFDNNEAASSAGVYLDIRKKVEYGGEMGLLGLAFHPKFKDNGFFYVNYTKGNPRETVVSRFKASSANASTVEPGSEVVLFKFSQPYSNHNGGKVLFGPDGYLYVSTGDGGSGGDPQNNGQNRSSWLGKILRVDVNGKEKGNYSIPADNPFKGGRGGAREEIFAYGLRNPWRISFDEKGQLWAGDVGQNKIEEIDIVTKGGNYGWRVKEADQPFNAKDNTVTDKLVDPIWQYTHDNGDVSVTGGVVYRGQATPALRGKYIYADFASGRVWALTQNGTSRATNQEVVTGAGSISAFGEDQKNEMYLCDLGGGQILKLSAK